MNSTVLSVHSKDTPGVGKIPRESVTLVAGHGVEGDYHAGANVRHRSRAAANPDEPNLRQVHLMHAELFDELAPLGIRVEPGNMGENITTRGLALLDLAPSTKLHLGENAVTEITGCRNPCAQLDAVDERLLAQVALKADDGSIIRKAGIMAIVLVGGVVRPGDAIRVEAPAGAAAAELLQPV
ncbi:MAG: MOSC domain-containing protein [Chloroflexota bacterium]